MGLVILLSIFEHAPTLPHTPMHVPALPHTLVAQLSHDVAASARSWDITISMTNTADRGTSHAMLPQLQHPWISGLIAVCTN